MTARTLIVGAEGLLGNALMRETTLGERTGTTRKHDSHLVYYDLALSDPRELPECKAAILCAGTKGFAECEGNIAAFKADVDGNLKLARHLLFAGVFVTFISTDAVMWGAHTAYARNRLLVEMALIMQPNTAIVRPSKFFESNVAKLSQFVAHITAKRLTGLHYA